MSKLSAALVELWMPSITESDANRFWTRVDRSGECWLWTGATSPKGYGRFWAGGVTRRSHRVAWKITNGDIPDGLLVLHKCDTPRCVRPDHLFLGTYADNNIDCRDKGRSAFGDRNGSRIHPERLERGERRYNSKLTEADVRSIRKLKGLESQYITAAKFGVSQRTVCVIQRGNGWRHVG